MFKIIESIIRFFGNLSAFFCFILVLVVAGDALTRYFFNVSYSWVMELEWHLFSLIFLFGVAYALGDDRHVRVDVLYNKLAPINKSILNVSGHILFLIPWCLLIIVTTWKFVLNSFLIREGSPNPDGLPYRFVIKSAILVGFVLLLLQGFLAIIKEIRAVKAKENY